MMALLWVVIYDTGGNECFGSLYPLVIWFEHMGLCHETDGVEECCITRAVPRVVHETNDTTFGRFTNGVDIQAHRETGLLHGII